MAKVDTRTLTETELEFLVLMQTGASYREMAAMRYVSIRTVHSHLSSILKKTGYKSRVELISTILLDRIDRLERRIETLAR